MKKAISLVLILALMMAFSQSCFAEAVQTRPLVIDSNGFNIAEEDFIELLVDVVAGKYPDYSEGMAFPTDVEDCSNDTLCMYSLTGFTGLNMLVSILHATDNEEFAMNDKDSSFDNIVLMANVEDDANYTLSVVYMSAIIYLTNKDINTLSEALEIIAELKYDDSVFYQYGPLEYQIGMVGSNLIFCARETATYKK